MKKKVTPQREIANSNFDLPIYRQQWVPVRPGAQDHERVPSLQGRRRVYRDGRVEAAK